MSTGREDADEDLMRAYVAGDEAAFRVLFDRYAPSLVRLTRRHLDTDEDARDVVQQTFVRLHRARKDFRDGARLRPWVFTIAMNLVREHWRRKKRRPVGAFEDALADVASDGDDRTGSEERARRLHAALAEIPETQREVVELHWFQELPFAEVASIVGSSEGAVRVRAHRAYTRLKQILGAYDP